LALARDGALMAARLGQVLYWAACGLALLTFGFVAYLILIVGVPHEDWPVIGIISAMGVVVWLIGRAFLYVLAGR